MRRLVFERLYSLKQYENVKFIDDLTIDFDLGKEVDLYKKLRYLQFIQSEMAFREYLILLKKLNEMNLEDSIEFLTAERTTTIDLIKQAMLEQIRKES